VVAVKLPGASQSPESDTHRLFGVGLVEKKAKQSTLARLYGQGRQHGIHPLGADLGTCAVLA
jgi:hypothetical protein